METHCFNIIIAGGKGTRFWPLSRAQRPKQLLKILSRKSLIDETAERVYGLSGRARTLVVTVAEQVGALKEELPALPLNNFIAEPLGKNTAPCIGLAALEVMRRDPNGVMVVLPADHWVADVKAFQHTLKSAVALAKKHARLVTIGIRPDYPETGYGYIMKSDKLAASRDVFQVKRFIEKPKQAAAKKLIRQGSLWNSGIFVWNASLVLDLLNRYQPEIGAALSRIAKATAGKPLANPSPALRRTIAREYGRMPSISIDFAVLEKAGAEGRVITVEGDFGWSDVGSWSAVHRMMGKDVHGNAGNGRWLQIGAKNCLIHSPDRLVVLLGIDHAVVVDTPDAILVGDLNRSQEVRDIVTELQRQGLGSYTVK